jgi:catechol 2,3-dioxygenase-like lactoylglutathione lyase family enzyme
MFDHVSLRTSDLEASEGFYETVVGTLGLEQTYKSEHLVAWGDFALAPASAERPVTRRLHIGFDRAATEAGYRDNGPPGERPVYHPGYYGAFVLDPDGNNIEVVNHNRP